MIIRFPTAFYDPLLPDKSSDAGDVTFTISTQDPPRPKNASIKVPDGIAPRIDRDPISRVQFGDLVFTVTDSSQSVLIQGNNQYFLGDVLEFTPELASEQVAAAPNSLLEVRHDLSRIDYKAIGLSDAEILLLSNESASAQEEIRLELNAKRLEYENNNIEISNTQKLLNETNKTLSAIKIVYDRSPSDDILAIITKLELKASDLDMKIKQLVAKSSDISAETNDLVNKARGIGVVVI